MKSFKNTPQFDTTEYEITRGKQPSYRTAFAKSIRFIARFKYKSMWGRRRGTARLSMGQYEDLSSLVTTLQLILLYASHKHHLLVRYGPIISVDRGYISTLDRYSWTFGLFNLWTLPAFSNGRRSFETGL